MIQLIPRRIRRIFISYPHEKSDVAEEVTHALRNQGYDVFFDRSVLRSGEDYHATIRRRIQSSNIMIVLLSSEALKKDSYVLTEVNIAQDIWPSGQGKILPFLLDPSIDANQLPPYVRSIHVLKVEGNPTAAILSEVAKHAGRPAPAWRSWLVALAAMLAAVAIWVQVTSKVHVTITEPGNNSAVCERHLISGTVTGDTNRVWLIIRPRARSDFYVQPPITADGGHWRAESHFGDPGKEHVGMIFELRAFVIQRGSQLASGQVLSDWPLAPQVMQSSNVVTVTRANC